MVSLARVTGWSLTELLDLEMEELAAWIKAAQAVQKAETRGNGR